MLLRKRMPEVRGVGNRGAGERPESGALYIQRIENKAAEAPGRQVVGVIGRFWSLDREENWDRIEKSYRWLVHGEGSPVYPATRK